MTTFSAISAGAATSPATPAGSGWASLGQKDFFRLLTVQMEQQDPFQPVDNKEMLAQMAQFSSLAGISDVNKTLQSISDKLDALGAARAAASTGEQV